LCNSKRIFTLQKKIIRNMVGAMSRNLYIYETEMLLLPCEYIFVLMNRNVNSLESSHSYKLHTVLTQGITVIFKDQLQLFLFPECTGRKSYNPVRSVKSANVE
jgi:hypothetical protein